MIILGLNAFHADSSAALVRDGVLVAAVEEERFRRVKHWAGFPAHSIAYCLSEAKLTLADVEHVAINQDSRAQIGRKALYTLTHRPDASFIRRRLAQRRKRARAPELLERAFPGQAFRGSVHAVEHHLSHLYSAFYVSPFEEAATVSIDGFGDFSSTAWGMGRGDQLTIGGRVFFPHSLGIFYQALCQYLGFPNYGDEYKVMGLAPYGAPSFINEMRRLLSLKRDGGFELNLKYFRHHTDDAPFQWEDGSPQCPDLFAPELEAWLGPRRDPAAPIGPRDRDLACSIQAMYEEAFFNLLHRLQADTGAKQLALAGGCAANSVANGKVRRRTPFTQVYVQSAAGDAGGAIGAAFATHRKLGGSRTFAMDHAYWGPGYDQTDIDRLICEREADIAEASCTVERVTEEAELCRRVAAQIADGRVVGWFQGRLEWGPRALGNRSILCDPRQADMKAILNAKIKRRESFRPFAPSVLAESVGEWFEEDDRVPFMMQVFQIRAQKRSLIPAVTHVDGSGRLQTVDAGANPKYHRLIEAFRDLTGVPMVLNTSFNENEPVVCRPAEALDCFLRTKMDALVLNDTLVVRSGDAS